MFFDYNTQSNKADKKSVKLVLHITLIDAIDFDLTKAPFDPFIFRTSSDSSIVELLRKHETHLIDHEPTALVDTSLFGTADDNTDIQAGKFYRTSEGLPWALEISGKVSHVSERTDFVKGYPSMVTWAESSGSLNKNWYLNKDITNTWKGK